MRPTPETNSELDKPGRNVTVTPPVKRSPRSTLTSNIFAADVAGERNASLSQTNGCIETTVFVDGALCSDREFCTGKKKPIRAGGKQTGCCNIEACSRSLDLPALNGSDGVEDRILIGLFGNECQPSSLLEIGLVDARPKRADGCQHGNRPYVL